MSGGDSTIRIAYLITVHKNPAQVGRLLKRLYYPGCHFFIHVSANALLAPFSAAAEGIPAEALHFTRKRMRIRWGDFSLTAATLDGLAEILNANLEPDFIFLLSGQDYPLTTNQALLSFLEHHIDRNFVPCHALTEPGNDHLVERLNTYRIPLWSNKVLTYPNPAPDSPKKKILDRALAYSRLLPTQRPTPLRYTPYFGSNWLRIKPTAARYLLTFLRQHPAFVSYFRYVLVPEEYIYQTILANTDNTALRESLYNDNFTYAHWDRPPELYPIPLDMSDKENLIHSGKFFARKFDETHDTAILDWLDAGSGIEPRA
ncbi:beta-1,6-N-acetylglucosaminyltransferase [Spirosoma koreense]